MQFDNYDFPGFCFRIGFYFFAFFESMYEKLQFNLMLADVKNLTYFRKSFGLEHTWAMGGGGGCILLQSSLVHEEAFKLYLR